MGKKGGGGESTQTSVQKADPWSGVQPNLLELYGRGSGWFNGGNTTAGTNDNIQRSFDWNQAAQPISMGAAPGLGSSPGVEWRGMANQGRWTAEDIANGNSAMRNPVQTGQMLTDNAWAMGDALKNGDNSIAAGKYLDQENPYLSKMVDGASSDVMRNFKESIAPSLASQFSMAGRTGSGSHVAAFDQSANTLAGKLGDISSNIRGNAYNMERGLQSQAYEAERQRQYGAFEAERGGQRAMWMNDPQTRMQAAGMAPMFQQMDQNVQNMDLQRGQFGLAQYAANMQGQQANQQSKLAYADALERAGLLQRNMSQEQIDDPLKKLQAYSSLLQGASGYGTTTGSQTTPQPKTNRVAGAIGGGLGGYALANMIVPGSGMVGAALGGLGGLFG